MAPSQHDNIKNRENCENSEENNRNVSSDNLFCNNFKNSLAEKIKAKIESKDKFFSLEFFPPRTKAGAVNLVSRLERMKSGSPLFVDITWHPAGNPSGDTETSSMMISHVSAQYLGLETMLHMTCVGSSKEDISSYLNKAKKLGLRNILALRGDLPNIDEEWSYDPDKFNYGTDLVRHIKEDHGDYFTVCVAGYPTGHPEANSYEDDLIHLKEKVDAGADFIITQLFFKAETFTQFVKDCRAVGINCPIIPGIMPIQSYDSLRHIVKLSKLDVPKEISDVVEPLKDNNEAIQNYGIHQATEMIKEMFNAGVAPGVHFYTLNKEVATTAILKKLGLWLSVERPLPWSQSAAPARVDEGVRPIFWSNNSRSYIHRSRHWTRFPDLSWSQTQSLAEMTGDQVSVFYLSSQSSKTDLLKMWGQSVESEEEVWRIMSQYYNDEERSVTRSPWCDADLCPVLRSVSAQLSSLCSRGLIIVNCQLSVDGVSSSDPLLGWGQHGGLIYQVTYHALLADLIFAILYMIIRGKIIQFLYF